MKYFWVLLILNGFSFCEVIFYSTTQKNGVIFDRPNQYQVEICAKAGCVRGKHESGRLKPYEAFYGIPYAEPPVGKLRLENPVPYRGWSGSWDATYSREDCLQRNYYISGQPILGSEDCLYLNIYRPIISRDRKLPVLIFIHGGAWLSLSGNVNQCGPEYLMDNGEVILVTMNYRLGIFGFLCSGDEEVKGNFGLKDQQLALQWIAANIEYFGGDPNSITLAGQSVGAMAAHLHMMNPISQDLFHRVIIMSSNALSSFMAPIDFAAQFRSFANYSGIENSDTASTAHLADQLKTIDGLTLVLSQNQLFAFPGTPIGPLRPCVEGNWDGAFMTEDPKKVWAEGRFEQKPILTGTVAKEGNLAAGLLLNQTLLAAFNERIYELLPIQIEFPARFASEAMKLYFGDKDYIDESNAEDYYRMMGDRLTIYSLIKFVKQYLTYADVQKNPVFIYKFDFKSSYTYLKYMTGLDINLGPGHIDDLFYLFTMSSLFPPFEPDSPEGTMVDTYVRTFVNFATRGSIKSWRYFRPCNPTTSTPFCDYQIFQRYEKMNPNRVKVQVSNEIDAEMYRFWSRVDDDIEALTCNVLTS